MRDLRNVVFGLLASSVLLLGACDGASSDEAKAEAQAPSSKPVVGVDCVESPNDAVRLKLEPWCGGCHTENTNLPFFASLRAFEELLVYNPAYVDQDDLEQSLLLKLLEGTATGTFSQMPLGAPPYAEQAAADETAMSMEEIRQWLSNLPPMVVNKEPDADAQTVRRITAEELRASMLDHMGLTMEDDFIQNYSTNFASPTVVLKGSLPLWSDNEIPKIHYVNARTASTRMTNLGGPNWLKRQGRSFVVDPTFLQTLVQVSQAWCTMAVAKTGNTALFRDVAKTATSDTAAAEIRQNLRYLYLRFIGDVATDAEIDALFDNVFVPYETSAGPETGWRAVCTSLTRHPRYLSH